MLQVVIAASEVEPFPLQVDRELARGSIQHSDAFGNRLPANAISGNYCDTLGIHVASSWSVILGARTATNRVYTVLSTVDNCESILCVRKANLESLVRSAPLSLASSSPLSARLASGVGPL